MSVQNSDTEHSVVPFTGSCLCGSIKFEIHRKYLNAIHCYCGMCRKAHGTAFSTHSLAAPSQVQWTEGKSLLTSYESSPGAYREFCPVCGTHILVHGQSGDDSLAFPAGTINGNPSLTILGHMYTEDLVSWYVISDNLPQHRQWPPGFGSNGD